MSFKNNQSQKPYYDDYNPEKNYMQILAVPGTAAQARDFTQSQSITLNLLSRLGNSVYKEGALVEGGGISILDTDDTSKGNKLVRIAKGQIVLDGIVRIFEESKVYISGTGKETICAKVETSIITEQEDASLRDPAIGYNEGEPGSHRLKQVVVFSANAEEGSGSTIIYTLVDGTYQNKQEQEDYKVINETLARRTYDESGNFRVRGLQMIERDDEKDCISVLEGKAYINGFEVEKPVSTKIKLAPSLESSVISMEPHPFKGVTDVVTGSKAKYHFNYSPLKENTTSESNIQIYAKVEKLRVPVTYNASGNGTPDKILDESTGKYYTSISMITGVYKNKSASDLTMWDGPVLNNDAVDWTNAAQKPQNGATYYVSFKYQKLLELNKDYVIKSSPDRLDYWIEITGTGSTPMLSTIGNDNIMYFSYKPYLCRRDMVLLDQHGEYSVLSSPSANYGELITPYNGDKTKIELGYVDVLPNSTGLEITNYKVVRLTQPEIFLLKEQIEDMQYNQALKDLDDEAEAGESATGLRGIYTDGFIGTTKCDLEYFRDTVGIKSVTTGRIFSNGNESNVGFNASIDYDKGELIMPLDNLSSYDLTIKANESFYSQIGRILMAPYNEEIVMSQKLASSHMLVNPYAAYTPMSVLKVTPPVDNWIDTKKVKVNDTINKTVNTTSASTVYKTISKTLVLNGRFSTYYTSNSSSSASSFDTSSKSTTTTTSTKVTDSLIEYMRVKRVRIEGNSFASNCNVVVLFDGKFMKLQAEGMTEVVTGSDPMVFDANTKKAYIDANATALKADASGHFEGSFMIPENTPCGTILVQALGGDDGGIISEGTAEYTAKGILRTETTTKTTTITTTNVKNVVTNVTTTNTRVVDPLAQSFKFSNDTILTKVNLYFRYKSGSSDNSRPMTVQVRNMVNGYPGDKCYSEVVVPASKVNISEDASAVTTISFEQPVYCKAFEEYCIVVLSDSNRYALWIAELKEKNITNGADITEQPYIAGNLFSSSNASTWSAHQTSDMKIDLIAANFNRGNGYIVFNKVSTGEATRFLLSAEFEDQANAGIAWYFKPDVVLDDGSIVTREWMPVDTFSEYKLDYRINAIQFKVDLFTKNNMSAMIAADCTNFVKYLDSTKGTYVSRNIYISDEYYKVKIIMEVHEPKRSYSTILPYFSYDLGGSWVKMLPENFKGSTRISEDWVEMIYEVEIPKSESVNPKNYRVRVDMQSTSRYFTPKLRRLRSILTRTV